VLTLSRLLIGLGSLLLLLVGLGFWFDVEQSLLQMGITTTANHGLGTVRADIGGFFLGGGALGVLAALSLNRNLLWPVQLLLVVALIGRLVTLGIDGPEAAGVSSMGIEILLIAVFQWSRNIWPTTPL
jgi:hypothetical protein